MNEDEILTACALRFDGYKYQTQTGFDPRIAIANYFQEGQWQLEPNQLLATFFFLQRSLYKYDLQQEPKDSKFRKAFRSLFFECADLDIPSQYQQSEYYQNWESRYKPNVEELKKLISKE